MSGAERTHTERWSHHARTPHARLPNARPRAAAASASSRACAHWSDPRHACTQTSHASGSSVSSGSIAERGRPPVSVYIHSRTGQRSAQSRSSASATA
eukprot:scaffold89045_cov32-Tisochrysis_lutea.AAC.11